MYRLYFQKYIDLYCKEVIEFLTTVMCVQFGWGSSSKCRWEWIFLGDPAMSYKTRWDLESPLVYCLWYQEFPTPKGAIGKIHIFGPENKIYLNSLHLCTIVSSFNLRYFSWFSALTLVPFSRGWDQIKNNFLDNPRTTCCI